MSGYSSQREVREVIVATLRQTGLDPSDYNITGIMRDAFTSRGYRQGWSASEPRDWYLALAANKRRAR